MAEAKAEAVGEVVFYKDGITPFWKKLPEFFRFPFHAGPMVVILSLSAMSAFGAFFMLINGLAVYLFLRYAFSVMEQASNGDFRPDSPDVNVWGGTDRRPLKQAVVTFVYIAILIGLASYSMRPAPATEATVRNAPVPTAAAATPASTEADDDEDAAPAPGASRYSRAALDDEPPAPPMVLPGWFWLVALLCAIPLPAAFMVIAVEDSLTRALNPLTTFQYVGAMGGGYFILWAFFVPIIALRMALGSLLPDMAMFIKLPILFAVGSYLLLALFTMMGYCMYQYHQELGYAVKVDFDAHRREEAKAAAPVPAKPVDPLTRKIDDLVAANKVDDAIRVVQDEMRFEKLSPDLNERLHKLLVLKGDNAAIVKHGPQYVKALVKGQRSPLALKTVALLKTLDAAYEPEADVLLGLAEGAFQARDYAKAVALVKGFDKRFPGHADIPGVYFLGARIMSEHAHDQASAMKILKALLQRFPEATVAPQAKQYLEVLAKVAPQPA